MQFSTKVQRSKNDLVSYACTTKSIYQNNLYEFTSFGFFKHYLAGKVFFEGTYKLDSVEQLIIATSNDTEKVRIEVFKFSLKDVYMDLLIMDKKAPPFANTTFPLVFKLERIEWRLKVENATKALWSTRETSAQYYALQKQGLTL